MVYYRFNIIIYDVSSQSKNSVNYWKLLNYLFSPTDAENAAGLSYLRVPLGASDFSASRKCFSIRIFRLSAKLVFSLQLR